MSDFATPLGSISEEEFLREYWQQQPLLIRNAFPSYQSPLSADELAGLATDPEVESRIVVEEGAAGPWELRHGPFSDEDFAGLPETNWTLLVQAIDLWVPQTRELLSRFSFLPAWRLDDLMVSFAPTGGSVGPHFDQYDVFLLQVEGDRRWQLGGACDETTALAAGTDLQIVDGFVGHQDWLLKPGDMLYVPPNIAHWGVAETDCLTYSIGFRSPLVSDMLGDLAMELAAQDKPGARAHYRDPPLTPEMANEQIDPAFIAQARRQLLELIDDDDVIADWFARYMTAPKYPDLVDVTDEVRRATLAPQNALNGRQRSYKNGERE